MRQKLLDFIFSGIKCDSPNCGYYNSHIKFEEYKSYIGKPCPKCGDNLLTSEDYFKCLQLYNTKRFTWKWLKDTYNFLTKKTKPLI